MSVCKKIFSFLTSAIVLLCFLVRLYPVAAISVSAQSAILIDAQSGKVLYEKSSDQVRPMASTTKIMTALVAIENFDLDKTVSIPKEATGIEGSSIYLCAGEKLTLRQLVYALMLSSANDAATAIAIYCAGSVESFAEKMNETANSLGLKSTHFDNPHGLDSESHYTTASDLAKLTAYAIKNPEFKKIVSTYRSEIPLGEDNKARLLVNHNKLLRTYEGAIGVKTGFTKKSGRCLVSAAERNGTVLIAVTLNAPDDWRDHATMLDYGFDNYLSKRLAPDPLEFSLPVISGTKSSVSCTLSKDLSALLPKDHGAISCRIEMSRFEYAPVSMGETVGKITYICDGKEIASSNIIAIEGIELKKQKYTVWDKIVDFFTNQ